MSVFALVLLPSFALQSTISVRVCVRLFQGGPREVRARDPMNGHPVAWLATRLGLPQDRLHIQTRTCHMMVLHRQSLPALHVVPMLASRSYR